MGFKLNNNFHQQVDGLFIGLPSLFCCIVEKSKFLMWFTYQEHGKVRLTIMLSWHIINHMFAELYKINEKMKLIKQYHFLIVSFEERTKTT